MAGVNPAANPDNSVGTPPANLTSLHYLTGAFANLQESVEGADAAPTVGQRQAFAKQMQTLTRTLAQWQHLKQVELPRLNTQLRSAGLQPITP